MVDSETQRKRESRLRSILKAFTWRLIASATTFTVAYFVVLLGAPAEQRELATKAAVVVAAFDFVLKLLLYYFHERIWQLVPRGSIRKMIHPSK
jgi:uncharacterized membrane protein